MADIFINGSPFAFGIDDITPVTQNVDFALPVNTFMGGYWEVTGQVTTPLGSATFSTTLSGNVAGPSSPDPGSGTHTVTEQLTLTAAQLSACNAARGTTITVLFQAGGNSSWTVTAVRLFLTVPEGSIPPAVGYRRRPLRRYSPIFSQIIPLTIRPVPLPPTSPRSTAGMRAAVAYAAKQIASVIRPKFARLPGPFVAPPPTIPPRLSRTLLPGAWAVRVKLPAKQPKRHGPPGPFVAVVSVRPIGIRRAWRVPLGRQVRQPFRLPVPRGTVVSVIALLDYPVFAWSLSDEATGKGFADEATGAGLADEVFADSLPDEASAFGIADEVFAVSYEVRKWTA